MLRVYRGGGDIHCATAAAVLGVDEAAFMSWKKDSRRLIDCANEIKGAGDDPSVAQSWEAQRSCW